jgi:hypothetical protein
MVGTWATVQTPVVEEYMMDPMDTSSSNSTLTHTYI